VVKIFAFLDLDQNWAFFKGLKSARKQFKVKIERSNALLLMQTPGKILKKICGFVSLSVRQNSSTAFHFTKMVNG
jgi:hypothetical protein